MSFDDRTRNKLARMVGAARERLREDITAQLQSAYRMQPDGTALPLTGMTEDQRATAYELRELLEHFAALETGPEVRRRAFDRMVREIGFTALNRLAALRLCEERGLVVECVRQGMSSEGFQLFERLTGGALDPRYRPTVPSWKDFSTNWRSTWVFCSTETRRNHSVFPAERALEDVLRLLQDAELTDLWVEDETIGWIYQYYNDPAERKKMRESAAPRNSYELAVRNQFFTPRYVVEFLTDNTLGRIWYEMMRGETQLADRCRYLVRRPTEVFLGDVEAAAERLGIEFDADHVPETVKAAYRGDFVNAVSEETGEYRAWIALAVPPGEFAKITGQPVGQLGDYPHLGRVWDALDNGADDSILREPAQILVALCQFVLTSSGGPLRRRADAAVVEMRSRPRLRPNRGPNRVRRNSSGSRSSSPIAQRKTRARF